MTAPADTAKPVPKRRRWREFLVLIVTIPLVVGVALHGYQNLRTEDKAMTHGDASGLVTAIHQYFQEYRAFGTIDNANIIRELRGANTRGIVFLDEHTDRFNANGEFTDRWGMPFRIDVSDPAHPRVWSCGPDRHDDGGKEGSDDIVSWRPIK